MTVHDNIRNNNIKTFLLLFSYPLVLGSVLYLICHLMIVELNIFGRDAGALDGYGLNVELFMKVILLIIILIVGGTTIYSLYNFRKDDDIITLYNSQTKSEIYQDINRIIMHISITAGIFCPNLIIHPSSAMNAYATGNNPNNSTIILTEGLINNLNTQELEAVIAHEVAHIANRDTKLMMVVIMHIAAIMGLGKLMVKSTSNSARFLILLIIPILGAIICIVAFIISPIFRFAISRKREFIADSTAVLYTRNPGALMEALIIISANSEVEEFEASNVAALCISAPSTKSNFFQNIFRTHPPMDERIEAIMKGYYIMKN